MNAVGTGLEPGASSRVVSESKHSVGVADGQGVCPLGGRRIKIDSDSVGPLAMESETGSCDSDTNSVYSYGYGASDPAYPYLEIYNPAPAANAKANGTLTQSRSSAAVTARADIIEPAPSLTTIESGGGEEDELIPIMGGFVRRMATIQSFGSREAALSMARSRFSVSETHGPASPRSSIGWTPSMVSTLSKNNSLGTASAYFSASSDLGTGGTGAGVGVNERGELEGKGPPLYGRYHYTRDAKRTTLSVPC
jgi:hypothetical protein